ncbi:hypothetical protein KIN20_017186 [Parelaphostrongylus tenuis]|uniref:Uncharacterized protein n=1 Tax=Parelaphostrongylus tenuis TaxID=148309 RepID=A0AAD5N2B0_PARTN|nr:hypothetical protein KIN20_017186 [Parelaphostrongylus tenuis]
MRHREIQQPSIYNNPDAPLRLRLELNMSTEKQTKMVSNSDEIVPVPFPFEHKEKRTILALVNDPKFARTRCGIRGGNRSWSRCRQKDYQRTISYR